MQVVCLGRILPRAIAAAMEIDVFAAIGRNIVSLCIACSVSCILAPSLKITSQLRNQIIIL
jgi:hypothetical protein